MCCALLFQHLRCNGGHLGTPLQAPPWHDDQPPPSGKRCEQGVVAKGVCIGPVVIQQRPCKAQLRVMSQHRKQARCSCIDVGWDRSG